MSLSRNAAFLLKNSFTPMEYGAKPGIDCTAAVTEAAAAVFAAGGGEVVFPQGAWVINSTPTIPVGVTIRAMPGSTFSGAGAGVLVLTDGAREVLLDYSTAPTDFASRYIRRNANHTGGTPGRTEAALRVDGFVGDNVTNFEWVFTAVLHNHAQSAGENVAVYGQANKYTGAGPTWGGVVDAVDHSGLADPTAGLVGLEVDISADGTDVNSQRIGIDIVGGIANAVAPDISFGIRIGPTGGIAANCKFLTGVNCNGRMDRGVGLFLAAGSIVGIDISGSTLSSSAIRLAQGQDIGFEVTSTLKLKNDGTGLGWFNGATLLSRLNTDGTVQAKVLTVATLGAATAGKRSFVSDSNVAMAGNFGAVVAGGGANTVTVIADGANWRIG